MLCSLRSVNKPPLVTTVKNALLVSEEFASARRMRVNVRNVLIRQAFLDNSFLFSERSSGFSSFGCLSRT
jgi:hypothetical protein